MIHNPPPDSTQIVPDSLLPPRPRRRTSAGITVSRLAARIIDLRRQRGRWSNPAVRITSDTVAGGIREQLVTVGDIPGVLWTPAEGSGPRPLVLIGHGGGQH
jgi:hypothetical protein